MGGCADPYRRLERCPDTFPRGRLVLVMQSVRQGQNGSRRCTIIRGDDCNECFRKRYTSMADPGRRILQVMRACGYGGSCARSSPTKRLCRPPGSRGGAGR